MKKLFVTLLCTLIVLSSFCVIPASAVNVKNPGDLGDVDMNGKINLMDVTYTLKCIAGWDMDGIGITYKADAADVSKDGNVNLTDVTMNMKLLAGWYTRDAEGGLKPDILYWEW